jgi:hypothetical protein
MQAAAALTAPRRHVDGCRAPPLPEARAGTGTRRARPVSSPSRAPSREADRTGPPLGAVVPGPRPGPGLGEGTAHGSLSEFRTPRPRKATGGRGRTSTSASACRRGYPRSDARAARCVWERRRWRKAEAAAEPSAGGGWSGEKRSVGGPFRVPHRLFAKLHAGTDEPPRQRWWCVVAWWGVLRRGTSRSSYLHGEVVAVGGEAVPSLCLSLSRALQVCATSTCRVTEMARYVCSDGE